MQTQNEYLLDRSIPALHSESAGEYPLPDYNGDVKRILMIKPRVIPSGKFLGDDAVEFSGVVNYDIVYLDGENNVTHADFSTDYDLSVKVLSDEYVDADISTTVAAYNVRLIGPRKFSAKCSLESNVHITERRALSVEGDAFESYEPEVAEVSVDVLHCSSFGGDEREYAEELVRLEGAIVDEVQVLLSDVWVDVKSVTPTSEGRADIKGEMHFTLVYKNGDMMPEKVSRTFAYNESVSGDEIDSFQSVRAVANVLSVKSDINPDADGVAIVVSTILEPVLKCMKNEPLVVVKDAYLKERGTRAEYGDFNYTEFICSESADDDFGVRVALADMNDMSANCSFIHTEATPRVDLCEIVDNKVKISGEIRFSAIACEVNDKGEKNYVAVKHNAPFEQFININCQIHENMYPECSIYTYDTSIDIDGDSVYLSCSLRSSVSIVARRRQRCLGGAYLTDEEYSDDNSVITVYYPEEGESVFGIAKRFHTSVRTIAEDNMLSESVVATSDTSILTHGIKKLIIK